MDNSAQPMVTLFLIGLLTVIIMFIVFVVKSVRSQKQQAAEQQAAYEHARKLQRDLEEKDRISKEKARVEEEKRRDLVAAAFTGLIGSDRWDEDIWKDPDQSKKIDKLHFDAQFMKVLAYDPRYHIGLVRGTTYTQYLVSGERCNCPDFLNRKKPCKHMYFLGQYVTEHGYDFLEADYEIGLKDCTALLVGRFPGGKDAAKAALRERGCYTNDVNQSSVNLAVIGTTTAQKTIENLRSKEIRMIDYKDALQIFTSEIRHPEVC